MIFPGSFPTLTPTHPALQDLHSGPLSLGWKIGKVWHVANYVVIHGPSSTHPPPPAFLQVPGYKTALMGTESLGLLKKLLLVWAWGQGMGAASITWRGKQGPQKFTCFSQVSAGHLVFSGPAMPISLHSLTPYLYLYFFLYHKRELNYHSKSRTNFKNN